MPDHILTVKTALGIATIIETPEAIQSAVIGDQSAFKVEYLNRAVTIKPLRPFAKTNLYLQTAARRYDLRLVTAKQNAADYIVYLKTGAEKKNIIWRKYLKSASRKDLTLQCLRVGHLPEGHILLDLRLRSKTTKTILPESIWIRQERVSKMINTLFLSHTKVSKKQSLMLGISLRTSDLVSGLPIQIELKLGSQSLVLEIPKAVLWK
jgi:type IV secretory pathway VirB9-like protein